jgi:uncharacterized phage protein (TIGR01671 family)
MKQYKFRAKLLNSNDWIYGYYFKHLNRTPCPLGDKITDKDYKHYILQSGFSDWNMPKPIEAHEVDSKTVGMFTGITDRLGKEVYEDDIVQECNIEEKIWEDSPQEGFIVDCPEGIVEHGYCCFNVRQTKVGKVKFNNEKGYSELHLSCYDGLFRWESSDFQVIGNIHDNTQ